MNREHVKSLLYVNNEPKLYDLKNEFKSLLHIFDTDNNIERWNKYKKYIPTNDKDSIDCDVCELAVFVYYNTWNFLKEASVNANRPTRQYSMGNVRNYKYQLIVNHEYAKEYYRGDTMTSFSVTFNHYKNNFNQNIEIGEQIELLAKLYHSIGNMIPIPSYFNNQRSGAKAKYDFWDLTLKQVHEWYKSKQYNEHCDEPLKKLLNPEGKNDNIEKSLKCCKLWLSNFEKWNDFVNDNYLSDYMKHVGNKMISDEDGDYVPILFWNNHSYESFALPLDANEFYTYLVNLNKIIERRNYNILNQLFENLF